MLYKFVTSTWFGFMYILCQWRWEWRCWRKHIFSHPSFLFFFSTENFVCFLEGKKKNFICSKRQFSALGFLQIIIFVFFLFFRCEQIHVYSNRIICNMKRKKCVHKLSTSPWHLNKSGHIKGILWLQYRESSIFFHMIYPYFHPGGPIWIHFEHDILIKYNVDIVIHPEKPIEPIHNCRPMGTLTINIDSNPIMLFKINFSL